MSMLSLKSEWKEGRAEGDDKPLYEIVKGSSSLLLFSVHEGDYFPRSLYDDAGRPLEIANPADLSRHIVIDHGIREVTNLLAASTGAHVFRVTHSRLVADINRFPDEVDCVAPLADGTDIPTNKRLNEASRNSRLAKYFYPVIEGLKAFVGDVAAGNLSEPFVICMHSFTRALAQDPKHPKRHDVCVFSYPEFEPIPSVNGFVRTLRNQQPELVVGHNEPFSARTPGLSTSPNDKRLPSPASYYGVVERNNIQNHFALEICQDLISDEAGQKRMAHAIARALNTTFDFSKKQPLLR